MSNNYSPFMDKRSPQSPLIYERYKSGCAWSLMRFCDFRQDHSSRKLISSGKGAKAHVADDKVTKNRFDLLSDLPEKSQYIDDGVECKSVSTTHHDNVDITIKGEETATEKSRKNKVNNPKAEHLVSNSEPAPHVPKKQKRKKSKAFQMHGCRDVATLRSHENLANVSSKKSSAASSTEASCNPDTLHTKKGKDVKCRSISPRKQDQTAELKLQVKMNEAAEAFINQKFSKGRCVETDESGHQSKNFLDALEILNSNKDLFIKLLQDPNSLLVQHIQDLRDSQVVKQETKASMEEDGLESVAKKPECSSEGSVDPQTSDTIVVLKPDLTSVQHSVVENSHCSSPQSLYSLRNKAENEKPAYFSFQHMKRKFSHAIRLRRKEKFSTSTWSTRNAYDIQGLGDGTGEQSMEVVRSKSHSKVHFGGERPRKVSLDEKKIDKTSQQMYFESSSYGSGLETSKVSIVKRHKHKQRETYTDIEARKHLADMLRKANENMLRRQEVKTLGKNIFLPEYDLTALTTPVRHQQLGLVPQMRFSPYSNYQMINEKKQMLRKELESKYLNAMKQTLEPPSFTGYRKSKDQQQNLQSQPNISQNHSSDISIIESVCSKPEILSPRGSVKIVKACNTTSLRDVGLSCEADTTANTYERNGYLESSNLDSPTENCSTPTSNDTNVVKEGVEHSSPVSVLDQFSDEAITSPLRGEPVESTMEVKQIKFEEHHFAPAKSPDDLKTNSSNINNKHDSAINYVMTLLQVSDINWEELSLKTPSSEQLLKSSLFDQVQVSPDQSSTDSKLIFDHLNEVLLETIESHFITSPWTSLVKPKIRPLPSQKNMHYEIMKRVNWSLVSQQSFLTLEQLMEKDLAKPGTWMDIHIDIESAISEMVDTVIEELTWEITCCFS